MKELYETLKFESNPFSKFSAEEEIHQIKDIYYEPKYFKTLYDDINNNNSRFIFGQRGSGKSALMYKIISKIKEENHLFILIDDFSFITKVKCFKDYEIVFTKNLLKALVTRSLENKKIYSELNKIDREKISFFVNNFFETVSHKEFTKVYTFCQATKTSTFFKRIYNKFFNKILNQLISGTVILTSDLVNKSLGLPHINQERYYREYLPSISEEDKIPTNSKEFVEKLPAEQMNLIFNELTNIIQKLGFKTTIIFIDKVDETSTVKGNVNEICQYLSPLVTENRLILSGEFAFVFMLWNKLKPELHRQGVRFDKIKPVDVTWTEDELKEILLKRLKFYSDNKVKKIENIFEEPLKINKIIKLANGSPRDLLHLMSEIYDQQQNIDSQSKFLSDLATERGINKFLENYDFYAIYPPTKSAKEDIKHIIVKLSNINKLEFQVKDVAATLKIQTQAASSYIKVWKNYGIITENKKKAGIEKNYVIDDPKIEYIIKKQITIK